MAERAFVGAAAGSEHNDPLPRGPPGVPGPPLILGRLPGLPGGEPPNTSVRYSRVAHRAISPKQTETKNARVQRDSTPKRDTERSLASLPPAGGSMVPGWGSPIPDEPPNERPLSRAVNQLGETLPRNNETTATDASSKRFYWIHGYPGDSVTPRTGAPSGVFEVLL